MCVFSAMGDHYTGQFDLFKKYIPNQPLFPIQPNSLPPGIINDDWSKMFRKEVSREEFEELKRQVEDMKKILKVAAEYDAKNNEPHCEVEDKVKLLKDIAKLVGVNLSDVFPQPVTSGYSQTDIGDLPGTAITSYNVDYNKVQGLSSYTSNSGSL